MSGRAARPGELRETITIKRNTSTSGNNSMGEPTEDFTTLKDGLYAKATPLRGAEAVKRGMDVESRPVAWVIRWRSDITPKQTDRVVWRSDTYDVTSVVDVDGRNRFWEISGTKKDGV